MKKPKNLPENAMYCPIQYNDDTIVDSWVYQNESGQLCLKIKYPKTGRSHFYSIVNYIDQCFDEQYPELGYQLNH